MAAVVRNVRRVLRRRIHRPTIFPDRDKLKVKDSNLISAKSESKSKHKTKTKVNVSEFGRRLVSRYLCSAFHVTTIMSKYTFFLSFINTIPLNTIFQKLRNFHVNRCVLDMLNIRKVT